MRILSISSHVAYGPVGNSAAVPAMQAKGHEIRQAFLDSPIVKDLPTGVDLSIGCVTVPPGTKDFAPLIDQADREMYRRKRALG